MTEPKDDPVRVRFSGPAKFVREESVLGDTTMESLRGVLPSLEGADVDESLLALYRGSLGQRRRQKRGRLAGESLLAEVVSGSAPFAKIHAAEPIDRIAMVRNGVPARLVTVLARRLGIPKERLYGTIGIARATVDRKVKANAALNREESEAVLGIARLIGQVEQMIDESGAPEAGFDAAQWLAGWLERPLSALGGASPAMLMDTDEGRSLVASLVARMQSGAYA